MDQVERVSRMHGAGSDLPHASAPRSSILWQLHGRFTPRRRRARTHPTCRWTNHSPTTAAPASSTSVDGTDALSRHTSSEAGRQQRPRVSVLVRSVFEGPRLAHFAETMTSTWPTRSSSTSLFGVPARAGAARSGDPDDDAALSRHPRSVVERSAASTGRDQSTQLKRPFPDGCSFTRSASCRASGDPELLEDVAQVVLDRLDADDQLRGDLPVRPPRGRQAGDHELLRGEHAALTAPRDGLPARAGELGAAPVGVRTRTQPLEGGQRGGEQLHRPPPLTDAPQETPGRQLDLRPFERQRHPAGRVQGLLERPFRPLGPAQRRLDPPAGPRQPRHRRCPATLCGPLLVDAEQLVRLLAAADARPDPRRRGPATTRSRARRRHPGSGTTAPVPGRPPSPRRHPGPRPRRARLIATATTDRS